MTTTALKELLRVQPFRPFNIVLSSGDRFPVRHPEMLLVLKDRAIIALDPPEIDGDPNETVTISFLHIAAAEPISEQQRRLPKGFKA